MPEFPDGRIRDAFLTVDRFTDPRQGALESPTGETSLPRSTHRERLPSHVYGRIRSALSAYRAQTVTPDVRVQRLIERSESAEAKSTIAFLDREFALDAAADAGERWSAGSARDLEGITVGVKDIIDVAGLPTGIGMKNGPSEPATRDAAIVSHLRSVGAIPLAKLRTYEYAWAEDAGGDPVLNPSDPHLITGGSSNGSAAAVGFGLVDVALGSDTLGSTRAPAAFCGVVGLKLSLGALPTDGMVGLAPSLDCLGLIGASVADVSDVWSTFSFPRQSDHSTSPRAAILTTGPKSTATTRALSDSGTFLQTAGWSIDSVDRDWLDGAAAAGMVITAVESARQGWANPHPQNVRPAVSELLEAGRQAPPHLYQSAIKLRQSLRAELADLLAKYDVILSPVAPGPAPKDDSLHFVVEGKQVPWLDVANVHLAWSSLSGLPSISVPVRLESDGSITSLQVTARMAGEETVLSVASMLEWSL